MNAVDNMLSRLPFRAWGRCVRAAACVLLMMVSGIAEAAIQFVGADLPAGNSSSAITFTVPAAAQANDIMLVQVSARQTSKAGARPIVAPAGWASVNLRDAGNNAFRQEIFWRARVAGGPATFSFTTPAYGDQISGVMVVYRGVNVTTPIIANNGQVNAASTSITAPSINTTGFSNVMLVAFFGTAQGNATITAPGSMTNRGQSATGAGPNGVVSSVADELQPTGGVTGTRIATATNSAVNIGQLVGLRPARTFLVEALGGGTIGTQIVGTSFNIRITAISPSGATDTTFTGTVTISSTGNLSFGAGVTASFVNGVLASHTVRISNPGTFTITATQTAGTDNGTSSSFLVAPKLQILVPGETANPGSPTGKLGTPLAQTVGVVFTVTVNAVDEFWNVDTTAAETVSITSSDPAGVMPPSAALVAGTQSFSVTLNTPPNQAVTANAVTPTRSDTSPPVPLGTIGGTFNACDVGTACANISPPTYVRTKIAGQPGGFNLDIVALKTDGSRDNSYSATVRIELLDARDNTGVLDGDNCRPTWATITTLVPDPAFVPANSGLITVGPFNVSEAYPDVRVRVTSQTGSARRGCSTDNFAIRPASFASFSVGDTDRTTAGTVRVLNDVTFGATVHNAGRPFSVRATTVNAAAIPAVTTNYAGTPTASIAACAGAACTPSFGTLSLNTAFTAGQLVSDVATYTEVGSFSVQLIDDAFAAVDNADGSTLAERRIQSAVITMGRFVPDHFAVSPNAPSFTTACPAGSFSYIGQAFSYATAPVITVVARNFANNPTTLYTGSWWRLANSSLTPNTQAGRYAAAGGTLDVSGLPAVASDPVIVDAGLGSGTLTFSAGTGLRFARSAPVVPFDADIGLTLNVIDVDGVAAAAAASFGAATAGNGIPFSGGKEMRFGRLRLANGNGSNLVPLALRLEAQHWIAPGYFVTNTADSCTVVTSANVGLGNFQGGLTSGDTTASVAAGSLAGGLKSVVLSPPGAGKSGSVDIVLYLAAPPGGINACVTFGVPPTPLGADLGFLRGEWCTPPAGYDRDPTARARFGAYRGSSEFIYFRENY